MAVGQFDRELFLKFRGSKSATVRRLLLGRLLVDNEPLVKKLVGQLLGKRQYRKPGDRVARCPGTEPDGRIPGADILEWEDALQTGRLGMAKALESLDLEKGKLSYHALRNIHYELQVLMGRTAVVKVERGKEGDVRGVLASSYEDDDGRTDFFDAMTHQHVEQERGEAFDHGDFAIAKVDVERGLPRESAVETFVRHRLAFGRAFCVPRVTLLSAFEGHVVRTRGNLALGALRARLAAAGVRPTTIRVPWEGVVAGWRGVRLQSSGETAL